MTVFLLFFLFFFIILACALTIKNVITDVGILYLNKPFLSKSPESFLPRKSAQEPGGREFNLRLSQTNDLKIDISSCSVAPCMKELELKLVGPVSE